MAKKINKSERIRHALALKSNQGVSVADLAKQLKVAPGLIYALKWKAKNGKKGKKAGKTNGAATPASFSAGTLEHNLEVASAVSEGKPTSTLTDMLVAIQEAAVILERLRALVG